MRLNSTVPSWMRMKQQVDDTLDDVGQRMRLFQPASAVLADLNVVPSAMKFAGMVSGSIVFDSEARHQANAMGVFSALVALGTFSSDAEGLLTDRCALVDIKGRCWLVHGPPSTPEGPGTVGLICLVSQLVVKPNGVS